MYFFISYNSNALMHERSCRSWPGLPFSRTLYKMNGSISKHCDIRPSQWRTELLAPSYGLQAKAESTNCFIIYSKCFRFQNMLTFIDIKFLSLFFCFLACKEMFCLVDIKIGVITYRMVFWPSFLAVVRLFLLRKTCEILLFFHYQNKRI